MTENTNGYDKTDMCCPGDVFLEICKTNARACFFVTVFLFNTSNGIPNTSLNGQRRRTFTNSWYFINVTSVIEGLCASSTLPCLTRAKISCYVIEFILRLASSTM